MMAFKSNSEYYTHVKTIIFGNCIISRTHPKKNNNGIQGLKFQNG